MSLFEFWLFLHILAAIIAFGPTLVFPIIGALAAKNPGHLSFVAKLTDAIGRRLVFPFALSMAVSGTGLIMTRDISITENPWLGAAIVLYVIMLSLGGGHQLPVGARIVRLAEAAPPGPPSEEIMGLIKRQKLVGIMLSLLILSILVMMVFKPGG